MITLLCLGLAVVVVLGVASRVMQLMAWGVAVLVLAGALGLLVIVPDVGVLFDADGLFSAVRWVVVTWACAMAFRWALRMRRHRSRPVR